MAIVMPEESKWTERALFFHYDGEEQAIGIDSKVSSSRLAQAIHDVGVPIRLDGWELNRDSEFAKAFSWEPDPQRVEPTATIETLPHGTIGQSAMWALNDYAVKFAAEDEQEFERT